MSKIKIISVIAFLLILIGVIGSIATFKTAGNRANWVTLNEEIDVTRIQNIIIATDNANIEVLPHNESTVKIKSSGINPEKDVKTSVEEDALFIHLKHSRNKLFNFNMSSSVSSLKVYVPDKEFALIQIESDNGRIKGEGFTAVNIQVQTDNGLIELKHLKSAYILAEADNGMISFEDVEGELRAETDNGAIKLITDDLDRNIELTTDIGQIDIQTTVKPINAEITASVDLGSVSIFGHSNNNTLFGDGENKIILATDIGQIKVK